MNEFIIPVSWEHLDSMTHFLEMQMTRQNVPTVLRLRTQLDHFGTVLVTYNIKM